MLMLKKIFALMLASAILVSVLPISTFAAEKVPEDYGDLEEVVKDDEVSTYGFKKEVVSFALKYGGNAVGDLLGLLSKKNGDLVKKHSYELGVELDYLTSGIENGMRNFMTDVLDFPPAAARTIAWAIASIVL